MELIKTYKHVHHTETEVNFRISRMEDIWDERKGAPDEPHRHDFYTILLVKKANAVHYIDFNKYEMTEKQVFFVSPGQVHQIVEQEKSFGYVFMFSCEFLIRNYIALNFIDDVNLFNDFGSTPPLPVNNPEADKLSGYCEQMLEIYQSSIQFSDQALGSYLQLFLIQCNNLCTLSENNTQIREAGNTILRKFKQLVDENYAKWHNTTEYANALFVSPDHLNRVVKVLIGKTAKEFIQSRIIVAAKRLLYFSEQSLKEIAYELGFTEPANFSAFFKNITGIAPSEFRIKI
jgi:AraC family transcriptional regulator, transcriptional activator of pobA